jgi:hypothetical protein
MGVYCDFGWMEKGFQSSLNGFEFRVQAIAIEPLLGIVILRKNG